MMYPIQVPYNPVFESLESQIAEDAIGDAWGDVHQALYIYIDDVVYVGTVLPIEAPLREIFETEKLPEF